MKKGSYILFLLLSLMLLIPVGPLAKAAERISYPSGPEGLLNPAARVEIVATHATLKSLAESIGGDLVSVTSIIKPTQDPHFASAKPSYMARARSADLWMRIGMDMEIGYERLILEGSRNRDIQVGQTGHFDASENVLRLEVPSGKVDRSMGDVHPEGNPHHWLDPYNVRIIAEDLGERLGRIDPANIGTYRNNTEAFIKRLDAAMFGTEAVESLGADLLWQAEVSGSVDLLLAQNELKAGGWYGAMRPLKGSEFVSYHKSWIYFAHRFGLKVPIEIEPKPGIPPGPGHTLDVIQTIKGLDISMIAVEPYYNFRAAEAVAEKSGARVVKIPNSVGACPGGCDDYIALMDFIVETFRKNL